MKVLIVAALAALATLTAARPDVSHLVGQQPVQQRKYVQPPAILRQIQEHHESGDYKYNFKTENGIEAVGQAQLKNAGTKDEALVSEGTYSYIGDDGQTYAVNWVADEYGFRASGAHIPEIPEEIKKALEQSANEPEDDGQYREDPNSYDRPQAAYRQQQQQQQAVFRQQAQPVFRQQQQQQTVYRRF